MVRFGVVVLLSALLVTSCGDGATDDGPQRTPCPTQATTARPTSALTPSPTDDPLPSCTPAATLTLSPTANPVPTASPPPTPVETASPTAVPTPVSGVADVIRSGNTTALVATLTFDAGSDEGYTAQILDTLKANDIRAAFGVTGQWAERNPALLQRIVGEGHELINHSYNHASFTGGSTNTTPLTRDERWEQLDRTESIVQQSTGATTLPYFRPPYGAYDYSVNVDVGARGYRYNLMWTVDSGGWKGIPASEVTRICLEGARPGAIYVFHVGSASQDGPALQSVIDGLHAQGYSLIPLSEMLGL